MDKRKQVYQFLVELKDITPRIWRQIQIPSTYTFWDLHVAVQDAMGWEDCHLHAFRVKNPQTKSIEEIGIPDVESFDEEIDIATERLTSVLEPIMIVFLAVVVGYIVVSIVLPILKIGQF